MYLSVCVSFLSVTNLIESVRQPDTHCPGHEGRPRSLQLIARTCCLKPTLSCSRCHRPSVYVLHPFRSACLLVIQ